MCGAAVAILLLLFNRFKMSTSKGGQVASSKLVRQIKEVEGGKYDRYGFYRMPEGGKCAPRIQREAFACSQLPLRLAEDIY